MIINKLSKNSICGHERGTQHFSVGLSAATLRAFALDF